MPRDPHHEMSDAYRTAADRMNDLAARLRAVADDLDQAWTSQSSPLAQLVIRRIHDTTAALAARSWELRAATEASGDALNEAATRWPWDVSHMSPDWAEARQQHQFDQLRRRYEEVLGRYPTELHYDLPFAAPRLAPEFAPLVVTQEITLPTEPIRFGEGMPQLTDGVIGAPPRPADHRPFESDGLFAGLDY